MKNIVIIFTATLLFSLLCSYSSAQNSFVNTPSANSGAATNGEDAKLNLNNGTANVGIPLFTLQDIGISFPISLSYQTGGIRVSQPATEVGLGWNLNAGGMISREIKGFPDDITNTIFDEDNLSFIDHSLGFMPYYNECEDNPEEFIFKDTEPDIFTYNILGYTGKFFFDKQMNIVQVNESDVKIEVDYDPCEDEKIEEWKITLPDATVIHFGGSGKIESYYFEDDHENPTVYTTEYIPNGWLVSKIEFTNGRDLEFNYASNRLYDYVINNNYALVKDQSQTIKRPDNASDILKKTITLKKILLSIASSNYKVEFLHESRQDFVNFDGDAPKYIKGLSLQTKSGECINKILFDQSYFESDNSGIYYTDPDLDIGINIEGLWDKKRLKLDHVKIKSCKSAKEYTYDVDYYEDSSLPRRLSCSQDLWGFNNGILDNRSLVPKVNFESTCFEPIDLTQSSNSVYADRSVSFDDAKQGSLKKITYPNGYFNKFIYESNTINEVKPVFGLITERTSILDNQNPSSPHSVELKNLRLSGIHNKLHIDLVSTFIDLNSSIKIYSKPSSSSTYTLQKEIPFDIGFIQTNYVFFTDDLIGELGLMEGFEYDIKIESTTDLAEGNGTTDAEILIGKYYESQPGSVNTPVGGLRIQSIETPYITKNYNYDRKPEDQTYNNAPESRAYRFDICKTCPNNSNGQENESESSTGSDPNLCNGTQRVNKSNVFIPCNVKEVILDIQVLSGQCNGNSTGATFSWFGGQSGLKQLFNNGSNPVSESYTLFSTDNNDPLIQPGGLYNFKFEATPFNNPAYANASLRLVFESETITVTPSANISNGNLIDIPSYLALYNDPNSDDGGYIEDNCQYGNIFRIFSAPNTTLNTLNGGHIIYSGITETIGVGEYGYTEYAFYEDTDFLNQISIPNRLSKIFPLFAQVPTIESIYIDPIAGLPKVVKVYNANGEVIRLNTSSYLSSKKSYSFFRQEEITLCSSSNSNQQFTKSAKTDFDHNSFWVRLDETTSEEDGITTITNYEYRADIAHHNPIKVTTINPNGPGIVTQRTLFAHDVDTGYPHRDMLISNNAIGVPLISLSDNGYTGGSKTEFSLTYKEGQPERIIIRPDSKSTAFVDKQGNLNWKETERVESYIDQIFPEEVWSKFQPLNTTHTYENDLLKTSTYGSRTNEYFFDAKRRMYKSVDPLGLITEIEYYDGFNRVIKKKNQIDNGQFIYENYSYDIKKDDEDIMIHSTHFPSSEYDLPSRVVTARTDFRGLQTFVSDENYMQNGSNLFTYIKYNSLGSPVGKFENDGISTTTYSNDIRQRVEKSKAKGADAEMVYNYGTNANGEVPGYNSGALSKTSVTDENGNTISSFTNIRGNKIMSIDAMGFKTKYAYNTSDQLTKVIPPGSDPENIDLNYSYSYTDDFKLATREIPGRNVETIYYHPEFEYEEKTILHNGEIISYHYNDDYLDFLEEVKLNNATILKSFTPYHSNYLTSWVKEEKTRILETSEFLTSSYDYDDIGRVNTATIEYIDGGQDLITSKYDALDNLREATTVHTGNDDYTTTHYYDFDKGLRVAQSRASLPINGANKEITIHDYKYNSRDWVSEVKVNDGLHTNKYKYHPRGLIQKINSVESATDPDENDCDENIPPAFVPGCEGPFEVTNVSVFYDCLQLALGEPSTVSVSISSSIENEDGSIQNLDSNTINFGFNGGGLNEQMDNPTMLDNSFTIGSTNGSNGSYEQWLYGIIMDCLNQSNNPDLDLDNTIALESMLMLLGDELPDGDSNDDPSGPGGGVNSALFGMEIHYEDGNQSLAALGQKNGTISWIEWKAKDEVLQSYGFQYDKNYRLLAAQYKADDPGGCFNIPNGAYSTSYKYDDRGNFTAITRNGVVGFDNDGLALYGSIDDLAFGAYDGNEISSVTESANIEKGYLSSGGSYGFTNGNLTSDPNISSVTYNYLDLPTFILSSEGSITIVYDADGNKLSQIETKVSGESHKTVYMGQMEYVDNERSSLFHEGGRIMYNVDVPDISNASSQDYEEWSISDHLGNVRLRYIDKDDNDLILSDRNNSKTNEVSGTFHYYPYGMLMEGNFHEQQGVQLTYQYNGIEHTSVLGPTVGLTMYRVHDAAIGRWWQVDPKAEWGYRLSPYNSMHNNPIGYSDPDGDWIHIAAGALIGGVINTVTHWDDITQNGFSWSEFGKAAVIGAGAGALTAATGGAAVGAGFTGGALIGAGSGMAGDIVLQTGNLLAFNDEFSYTQTLLAGGLGALGGSLTGHFTKVNPATVPKAPTADVFDEFIDTYASRSVSMGNPIIDESAEALKLAQKSNSAFSTTLDDPFTVTASRIAKRTVPAINKAINSNLPHAIKRGIERGIFQSNKEAAKYLKGLTKQISKNGFPNNAFMDPTYTDRVLVPIINDGLAAYKLGKNGSAILKTILNGR